MDKVFNLTMKLDKIYLGDCLEEVKTPKKIKNQLILTCNPTGLNIFQKIFINNENNKD